MPSKLAVSRSGPRRCRVCRGKECCGGGVAQCWQRDPTPSVAAGILDTYGGLRFVVTHADQLATHVRADEIAIVVPDLVLHEPIAWGDIPFVVARIELIVDSWLKRGVPNEPHEREAAAMYQLRRQELHQRSLDLDSLVET